MPNKKIRGLDSFDLDTDLKRLRGRACHVTVQFKTFALTRGVLRLEPALRHDYLRARVARWLAAFRREPASSRLTLKQTERELPASAQGSVRISELNRLIALPGVDYIYVSRIQGLRRRPDSKSALSWYCVRGLVAIQVEGQTRGMQTLEERFVITRARSFEGAERRLKKEWAEYADPYLNSDGALVRWQLEKVLDVYLVAYPFESLSDPTEVYSTFRARHLKPEHVWNPRKKAVIRSSRARATR